jgi:ADP-ribosyl-[dinitrogen reductase] hydrolase
MNKISKLERFEGCLLGLACGDAVGTTVEFKKRGSFQPVTDMVGGGPFNLKPGEWTDDTSMALCIADGLLAANGFDAKLTMDLFCAWRENGYLSSTGECFDVGGVTAGALARYRQNGNPYSGSRNKLLAGNGCLMRLAPVPMFYFDDRNAMLMAASDSSQTTHGALECVIASQIFADIIWMALNGSSKEELLLSWGGFGWDSEASPRLTSIANGKYLGKSKSQIKGSGYVVDSLEAALWCFHKTSTFKDAILLAANLGDDADTTAAICGQLAGAYYGVNGIPAEWIRKLKYGAEIRTVAGLLMDGRK